ncbi:hypothetical protein FA95DRAFT_24994 [Auriscalpium vulgare]|uniref:Uncharacterized protein n=1 Tax=Auriscalpium vulgare TaxID=40419 RepID=A0ACB8SCL6_9AGAM|nr:hypothetical protein FA95DRAFT_24994 [Auriscalpium vulgare]
MSIQGAHTPYRLRPTLRRQHFLCSCTRCLCVRVSVGGAAAPCKMNGLPDVVQASVLDPVYHTYLTVASCNIRFILFMNCYSRKMTTRLPSARIASYSHPCTNRVSQPWLGPESRVGLYGLG